MRANNIRRLIFWFYARGGDILRRLYPEMAQVRVSLAWPPDWPSSVTQNPPTTSVGWEGHQAYRESYLNDLAYTYSKNHEPSVENLTWHEVLDSRRVVWNSIFGAQHSAEATGYPYFTWEGKVLKTSTQEDTGLVVADIREWHHWMA